MRNIVSIIIPTYNRCVLLLDAIASAAQQHQIGAEIIVVDDGSSDCTREAVDRLGIAVKYCYQEHRGTSSARNLGLRNALGEYTIFLDSDDTLVPNKTSIQLPYLKQDASTAVIYSRWKTTTLEGAELRQAGRDVASAPLPHLLCHNIAAIHSCLFRTRSLRQIGGFDETIGVLEDWDLLIRLALEGYGFQFVPDVTAIYRLHSGNKTHFRSRALQDGLQITEKVFQHQGLPPKYRKERIYQFLQCLRYLETIRRCAVESEYEEAWNYLMQLFESIPAARTWVYNPSLETILEARPDNRADPVVGLNDSSLEKAMGLKEVLETYIQSL